MVVPAFRSLNTAIQNAESLARHGDWNGALAEYRSILQDVIKVEGHRLPALRAMHLVVIDRFADLAVLLGYTAAAVELLSAMAALSGATGDSYGRDYASVKRMLIEVGVGTLPEARATLQSLESTLGSIDQIEFSDDGLREWESRRFWPRTDDADRTVLFAQLYLALGSILAAVGAYGEAIHALRRGLAFTSGPAPDLAKRAAPILAVSIAAALLERGDLGEAQREVDRLMGHVDEAAEPAVYVRVHEILAKLGQLRGEFGVAQSELHCVARLCAERGFELAECRTRLNLAQMLIFLNKTGESRINVAQAIAIARRRGDVGMLGRAEALMATERARLASVAEGVPIATSVTRMWLGEPAEAPSDGASLPANLDLPPAANYLALFEDRLLAAHWQLGQGSVSNARVLLTELRQTFQHSDSSLIAMRLDAFDALLSYYEQNYQAAVASLRRLLPIYAQCGMKPELWQLQRVLAWCLARTNAPRADRDGLTLLSETLLSEITSTLPPEDQAIYNLNKWTTDEEYLASEIDRLVAIKKQTDISPAPLRWYRRLQLARRLHALSQRIDRFKEDVAENGVMRGPARAGSSLAAFASEQLAQPSGTVTLKFLVLPDRLLVIERGRFRLRFGVSPVSRLQLRDMVRSWHEWTAGLRKGGDYQSESAAVAHEVGVALQVSSALGSLPRNVRSLRIVPDDSLHGFPFGALKHQDQYLVERFALSIHVFGRASAQRSRRKPAKALFVGVSAGTEGFPALTSAGEELAAFRGWTGAAALTELRNETATRASVATELQSCTSAHISCHGVYVPSHPESTGLVLVPRPPDHEVLSVADVAHLRCDKLEHLTLSSCWSADNFLLPGRWMVSFPQRFQVAGAETVLGCLWEVEQTFAVSFFNRYYGYLAELPAAEALARTQCDFIHNQVSSPSNASWADPMYWSGYRVYGGTGAGG